MLTQRARHSQLDVPFTVNEMFLPHFQRHAQSAQQQGASFPDIAALIRLYGLIARQCAMESFLGTL